MEKSTIKIWHYLLIIFIAVILALVVRMFIFEPALVRGASMAPTLQDEDRLLLSKMSKPHRFDVVVFHADDHHNLVKRVIGLPGEKIAYENDTLYIDDVAYEEAYLDVKKASLTDNGPLTNTFTLEETEVQSETVPEGHIFVMGDNRRISKDSREIGAIPLEQVVGVSKLIFYPFDDITWMSKYEPQTKALE